MTETKKAVQKLGWKIPDHALLSPSIVGAELLRFPVPPNLERAFGYCGNLRFLELGYCVRFRLFGYCDGGDHIASDESLWLWFLRHPVISTHLPESLYPTLHGIFTFEVVGSAHEQIIRTGTGFEAVHSLLLDRRDRRAYICRRDQTAILFALMEPEGADHHTVFVDGLLMSPGTEDYPAPPLEFVHELRSFLDAQLEREHMGDRADLDR